jgi:small nuclear ribonucleoprotein (snRNP)-like protein
MDLLIKKPVAANSIVSFRLTSGEELVGKLVSDDQTTFVISKPIVIASQMTQKGIMIAFAPFMTSVDDAANFTFKHSHVSTALIETREDVRTSYIEATTGLVAAPAGAGGLLKP